MSDTAIQTARAHRDAKLAERASLQAKITVADAVIAALDALISDLNQNQTIGPSAPADDGGASVGSGAALPLSGLFPDIANRIRRIVGIVNATDSGTELQINLINAMKVEEPTFTRNHLITALDKGIAKGIFSKDESTGAITVLTPYTTRTTPKADEGGGT